MKERIKKHSKKVMGFIVSVMSAMALAVPTFAADSLDITSSVTSSVTEISTQVMGIAAVIVPVVLAIVVAKIGFKKAVGMFKSMFGN